FNGTSTTTYYLVPEAGTEFGAVDITVEWDESVLTFDGVDETGGLYDTGTSTFFTSQPASNQLRINASRLDNQNITSSAGDYIATLSFSQAASGVSDVEVLPAELSFRRYDGVGGQEGVLVFPDTNTPSVLALLGDVASASPFSEATGDGLVEFEDLVLFSQAYNATANTSPTDYKEKLDIGPTADGSVFTLPQLDGIVEFEDLVIFSISYGLSAAGDYTNKKDAAPVPDQPVVVEMREPQQGAGAEVRIPVSVKDAIDLRAFSMQFDYDPEAVALVGVEETALTTSTEQRPVFLEAFTKDGQLWVDGAILGADVEAIHGAGPLFTLVVRQRGSGPLPTLVNVRARSSANQELAAKWEEGEGMALDTETPTEYALGANYPNPFNPATTISFDLPESGAVTLQVFDVMGRRVATLVDERRPAGQHTVRWDARQLSSGIYFYTLRAGDFVATRRMVLMK
ncbi:MAG: T9SS type A sorting domain-containing protein, partial [Bacteroidetes bacterium]|nr:T9SS type A sorting domain-containing protein [Bacteroidota bacterium]